MWKALETQLLAVLLLASLSVCISAQRIGLREHRVVGHQACIFIFHRHSQAVIQTNRLGLGRVTETNIPPSHKMQQEPFPSDLNIISVASPLLLGI